MHAIFRVHAFASIHVLSNVFLFEIYKRVQKDLLKGKHLGLSKNLWYKYKQLIGELVLNQNLSWLREPRGKSKI